MGGNSQSQSRTKSIINSSAIQRNVYPAAASVSKSTRKAYLFGDDRHHIMEFDTESLKITPVELDTPLIGEIKNYSGIIMLDQDTVYVAGGINKKLNKINKNFFLFKPISRTLEQLPPMHNIRYTFPLIYHQDRIYAIGGRIYGSDEVSLLKSCEYFDLKTQQWVEMPDMHIERCTCLAFIYQGTLWVFGGYTAYLKRSSMIERFNFKTQTWEEVNFRLYQGFEAGHIFSPRPDTITIVGGKIYGGECNYVHEIDMKNQTIINRKPMGHARVLSKAMRSGDKFFVLGGNKKESPSVESLDIPTGEWKFVEVEGMNLIKSWKTYGYSGYTLEIEENPKLLQQEVNTENTTCEPSMSFNEEEAEGETESGNTSMKEIYEMPVIKTSMLFGTDDEPFLLSFDHATQKSTIHPCPLKLKLKNYQGVCRLDGRKVFIGGGINRELKKIFSRSYIFDTHTFKVTKCNNMFNIRYTFPAVYFNNYVYVIGGRKYGTDDKAVTNECERMNVTTMEWERIAPLNYNRCTSMNFVYKGKIYIAGGYSTSGQRLESIEVLDPEINIWYCMGIELPCPLEASLTVQNNNKIFFVGGRQNKDDSNNIWELDAEEMTDIDEMKNAGTIAHKRCLHKGIISEDRIFIFGGIKMNNVEIRDRRTFELLEESVTDLSERISTVSYNKTYLKRASLV